VSMWLRRYSSTYKMEALKNLEGKTVCKDATGAPDNLCASACCPLNTCDTAPACSPTSATGEKDFDGVAGPLAMKSRYVNLQYVVCENLSPRGRFLSDLHGSPSLQGRC